MEAVGINWFGFTVNTPSDIIDNAHARSFGNVQKSNIQLTAGAHIHSV